jgi:hypothetical protein
MAYGMNGVCYVTIPEAMDAFYSGFPRDDGGGNYLTLVSATLSGSTVSYSVQQRVWNSNTVQSRTGSFVIPTCTEVTEASMWEITAAQGAQIGGAILLVWAVAWVIRVLSRFLSTEEKEI